MASIPRPTAPIADMVGGRILVNREWFDYFRLRAESGDLTAINEELAALRKLIEDAAAPAEASILGTANIRVSGQLSDGTVVIDLAELPDLGGGELLNIMRDEFGRITGSSRAALADLADVAGVPAVGNSLQWTGEQWEPGANEAGSTNLDGGRASSTYGGTVAIDGGGA